MKAVIILVLIFVAGVALSSRVRGFAPFIPSF